MDSCTASSSICLVIQLLVVLPNTSSNIFALEDGCQYSYCCDKMKDRVLGLVAFQQGKKWSVMLYLSSRYLGIVYCVK